MFLLTNITNIYSTTFSLVKTVAGKISLYSMCFITFSYMRISTSKISVFYLVNLCCLGLIAQINLNRLGVNTKSYKRGESTII